MRINLGKRLIIIVVSVFIFFCVLFMITNVLYFWKNAKEEFEKKITYMAEFTANSNSANVWNFNYVNIEQSIRSMLSDKTLIAVIFDMDDPKNASGVRHFYGLVAGSIVDQKIDNMKSVEPGPATFTNHIEQPIIYQNNEIGKVHLYFSDRFIAVEAQRQAKIFMVNLVIFVLLFSFTIYFTLKKQLLLPLDKIHQLAVSVSSFTKDLSDNVSQERWIHVQNLLSQEKANQNRIRGDVGDDELTDFMQAFFTVLNGFELIVSELSQYSAQLQIMNEDLEVRINNRTAELEASNVKISDSLKVLQQTQGQLIQQEKLASIGQLAAGVAHEINNPIGYVGSNINRLDEYFADLRILLDELEKAAAALPADVAESTLQQVAAVKKQIDYDFLIEDFGAVISDCRDGIKRVKEIVQSLKDFSHNVDEKDFSEVDVNAAIATTLKVVNNEIKYCCDVDLDLQLAEKVPANLGQIHQVISNLVVNASHAMKSNPKRGMLTIRSYSDDEYAHIDIKDTGRGIPQDIHHKIFDPFFTTKPIGEGTGLGLNICYDIIVNKHKGDLSFESEMDIGTTFKIKLPLCTDLHC